MPIFTGPKKPGIFTGLGEGFGIFGPIKKSASKKRPKPKSMRKPKPKPRVRKKKKVSEASDG